MLGRRDLLVRTGLGFAAAALADGARAIEAGNELNAPREADWADVRRLFSLTRDFLHFGGLYITSHPAPVQRAIEQHRRAMDENPVHYLQEQGARLEAAVLRAASAYLGVNPAEIALTDSTTMGLGLLYNGLDLGAGDEILTTAHDFYATHEAVCFKAERSGARVRSVSLYQRLDRVSADEIVQALIANVRPETRVIAVTWVHSSTGLKLPLRRIAGALAGVNATRPERERALLCVDGVHGLGVEDVTLAELGADFFVAGCHKWLFGPRGTGFVWGTAAAWARLTPTIPAFFDDGTPGRGGTPGGFHSFEHRWALDQAFALHQQIGKGRVEGRIHALNRQLKEGLATLPHVTLYTPHAEELSAGLICFDVRGLSARAVVARLRERRIIATTTPYTPSYARLAPGMLNDADEVEQTLREVRALG